MKDLAIFDLTLGFYMKFPPWSRILRAGIDHLGPKMSRLLFYLVFLVIGSWGYVGDNWRQFGGDLEEFCNNCGGNLQEH